VLLAPHNASSSSVRQSSEPSAVLKRGR
jgi:hypothetical protein